MRVYLQAMTVVCITLAGPVAAQLSDSEARTLFDQANSTFREANAENVDDARKSQYERAILLMERLIQEGEIHNAKLFYNLGNAYLLKDDLGRAILNYRRAERLDRNDPDLQKNLSFARSRRRDRIGVKTEQRVRQTLFFWHYDFSPATRVWLACLGLGGICTALTLMLWRGRGSQYLLLAVISGILLLANLGSLLVEDTVQSKAAYGVITAAEALARQGDGPNYPLSFKDALHAGTEFELLENRGGWLHIRLADDSEGWIPDESAEII